MTTPTVDRPEPAPAASSPPPPPTSGPPGRGPLARAFGYLAVGVALVGIVYTGVALLDLLAQRTYHSTASYPLTTTIDLQVGNTDVHVVGDGGDRIVVQRTIHRGFAHAHTDAAVQGDALVMDDGCNQLAVFRCSMSTTIHVPPHMDVEGHSGDGSISLRGLTGTFHLSTGDGDVNLDRLTGPLDLSTGDGDVDLRNVSAATARLSTGDGDVRVDLATPPSSLQLDTGDGDVDVCLPPGSPAYAVTTHTGDGDLDNQLPSDPRSSRQVVVTTGDGDVSLRLC